MSWGKVSLAAAIFLMVFVFLFSMLCEYFLYPLLPETDYRLFFKILIVICYTLIGATTGMKLFPKREN